MLPNMTSSKSVRLSTMPPSRSSPSLRLYPQPDSGLRKPPIERRGTAPMRRDEGAVVFPPSKEHLEDMQHCPQGRLRKSKTWASRISSRLPSLISFSSDTRQGSIQRKPVAIPPPQGTPPPPPYRVHDPPKPDERPAGLRHAPAADNISPPPDDMPPVAKRGTLTKQTPPPKPSPKPSSRRNSLTTDAGYLVDAGYLSDNPSPGKLRKDATTDRRRRSNSFQAQNIKGGYPEPGIKARPTIPPEEVRGRSVSAQVPAAARTSASGTRVTSSPAANPPSTSPGGAAGHSPSRGRLRRSWLPGGRSRSNSIDPSGHGGPGGSSVAWVISEEVHTEYNHSFLANGEKVRTTDLPEAWELTNMLGVVGS